MWLYRDVLISLLCQSLFLPARLLNYGSGKVGLSGLHTFTPFLAVIAVGPESLPLRGSVSGEAINATTEQQTSFSILL